MNHSFLLKKKKKRVDIKSIENLTFDEQLETGVAPEV